MCQVGVAAQLRSARDIPAGQRTTAAWPLRDTVRTFDRSVATAGIDLPQGETVRLHRWISVLAVTAAVLAMVSPAHAAWQPEQQVNPDDPDVTDVGAAYLGTAEDDSAVAVWLEWRGSDARVVAARRPVGGDWGPSQVVDDLTEAPGVTDGSVGITSMVVLPDGSALISYQEHDEQADADFVGRVVELHPDGSVSEELSGGEQQWQLVADAEGDWLATAREYDRCACENDTWYSGDGAAPDFLGSYVGFDLRFTLSRDDLVYYAVDDPDGLYRAAHTLRVRRIDAATGAAKTVVLLKPRRELRGLDIDANVSDDVDLVWSVRRPERRRADLVRAMRHPSGESWRAPHTVVSSGGHGHRPIGAPQVETSGAGKALLVWSTPADEAGRVDLDSAIVRAHGQSSSIRRLAGDVDPGTRSLAFEIRVDDAGHGMVAFRHVAACPADPGTACPAVSALLGRRLGRLHDPEILFASAGRKFESVATALSAGGAATVLTVERGATRIATRTG